MSNNRIWIRYHCNIKRCRQSTGVREGVSYCKSRPIEHKCVNNQPKRAKPYSTYNSKAEQYTLEIEALSEEAFKLLSNNYKQYVDESIIERYGEEIEAEEKHEIEVQQITERSPSPQNVISDNSHNHNNKRKRYNRQMQSKSDDYPMLEEEYADILDVVALSDKENENTANLRTYNRNRNRNNNQYVGRKRNIIDCIGGDCEAYEGNDEEDESNEITVCYNNAHLKELRLNRFRKRRRKNETDDKTKLSMGPKNELILKKLTTIDPNPSLHRNRWNDISRETFLDKKTLKNRFSKVRMKTDQQNPKGGQRGRRSAYELSKISNKIAGKVIEDVRDTPDFPKQKWFILE